MCKNRKEREEKKENCGKSKWGKRDPRRKRMAHG